MIQILTDRNEIEVEFSLNVAYAKGLISTIY